MNDYYLFSHPSFSSKQALPSIQSKKLGLTFRATRTAWLAMTGPTTSVELWRASWQTRTVHDHVRHGVGVVIGIFCVVGKAFLFSDTAAFQELKNQNRLLINAQRRRKAKPNNLLLCFIEVKIYHFCQNTALTTAWKSICYKKSSDKSVISRIMTSAKSRK